MRTPATLLRVLLLAAAALAGCTSTLVDENGASLVPTACTCTAPTGGLPVCAPGGGCDYVCQGDLLKCGGGCMTCTAPANASPACVQGACGFSCNLPARLCPAGGAGGPSCQVESDLSCGATCAPCPGPVAGAGRGVCQPGPAVGAGSCTLACDAGNHVCSDACRADTDVNHCGPSCVTCQAPANATPACTGGACAFTCNPGWMRCGGGCCRATAVATGGDFSCSLLSDGRVRCWGANDRGQLGDGSTVVRPEPVDVTGLPPAPSRAVAIAAGQAHACAVVAPGGTVYCWGDNSTGELGTAVTAPFSSTAVAVTGVTGVATPASASAPQPIAAGGGVAGNPPAPFGHTCAIGSTGLVCWGANGSGQLGDGTTTQSAVPRTLTGVSAATFVAAGKAFSCASAGVTPQALCWGDNGEGQVTASAPPPAQSLTPVAPALGGGFAPRFVATGRAHACGLEPGTAALKCFGANARSQLSGAPSATGKVDVTLTGAVGAASAVSAGGDTTCALLTDGAVQCWGANERGQTGTGLADPTVTVPTSVSGR